MQYYGIGRRKTAVAQAFITGDNIKNPEFILNETLQTVDLRINQKSFFDYFQEDSNSIQEIEKRLLSFFGLTLQSTSKKEKSIIHITVSGGGITGQKEAIYLALANAFNSMDSGFHTILKKQKLLTQDSRIKERKKYGLKKARKAPQYSKR